MDDMRNWILVLVIALLSTTAFAEPHQSIIDFDLVDTSTYLQKFHENPRLMMNTPPIKWDANGNVVPKEFSAFGARDLDVDEVRKARNLVREKICRAAGKNCDSLSQYGFFTGFDRDNEIEEFFFDHSGFIRTLREMESKSLKRGQLKKAPWSDSFWPMQMGMIARRWLDEEAPTSRIFLDHYKYYEEKPSKDAPKDKLSPAEKYDLLVGDSSFALTAWNWQQGKSTWDTRGIVPAWAGICHGWASAAIMTNAPKRSVTLNGSDGKPITFYPSDIKALLSAVWANSPPKSYVVGNRCNVARPMEDEMGRVIDPICFDVNPGTWHIAVVNQIGVKKKSFVIDAQYDEQIWNYPLYSYKYTYFNPQTLEVSDSLAQSMVKLKDFSIDKFKKYRSPEAKYVVGIAMEISYAIASAPSTHPYQLPLLHAVKMVYDLELDSVGRVIGGEWYSNFHPDFIWHFDPESHPLSAVEKELSAPLKWDGRSPLTNEIRNAAKKASKDGQPLATVVEAIYKLSQETE